MNDTKSVGKSIVQVPDSGRYQYCGYWNISGVPVLPENVILTFFRTCWCYSEAYNTGTQKWSRIVQYSCTSIWDLKYTFSKVCTKSLTHWLTNWHTHTPPHTHTHTKHAAIRSFLTDDLKMNINKRVTLVYLYHVNRCGTHKKIVDCKVGLCTSLRTVAEFL